MTPSIRLCDVPGQSATLLVNHREAFLLHLRQPDHGIDVDLDAREKICIAPVIALGICTA
jgi:hypothetical protein